MATKIKLKYKATYAFFLYMTMALLLSSTVQSAGLDGSSLPADLGKYYISTTGDDNNPGTLSSPWRTIQKAADTLKPGETVYVRGGTYAETIKVNVSGSSDGGMINFQNYANEIPIIDGTQLSVSRNNQALILLSNVKYIKVSGFELRNFITSSSSFDPAAIRVKDSSSNIQLLNNNVHHIENRASQGNAHGIHVLGNSSAAINNLVINKNQIHHLITGKSESLTLSGNIDGFVVYENQVYENNNIGIELAGFYGACSSPCVDQTRNGVVSHNTVYHIDSSNNPAYGVGIHAAGGIYADGATNIVIERNHIYANDFGIELASENEGKDTSNITLQNNYIHHNYGPGLILGGSDSSNGGSANNVMANNTFVENDSLKQGYGDITFQWNNDNNKIINNIIYTNSQKISVNKINNSGSGNRLNYNLMYNPGGEKGAYWRWDGALYTSWNSYKLGSGNDGNSVYGDPLFMDKGNNNIHLKVGSMAIDKGLSEYVKSGEYDYEEVARIYGKSVDMGALEYTPNRKDYPVVSIVVDGKESDWVGIPLLSSGTGNAKKLKALQDSSFLHVLLQGNSLNTKGQLFINTDKNNKTGFVTSHWKWSGAEYLLENGTLYRYSGKGGSDWKWTWVRSYKDTLSYTLSSTVMEISISLADLKVTGNGDSQLQIGYVWNDSDVHKLPASGNLINITNIFTTKISAVSYIAYSLRYFLCGPYVMVIS